MNPEFKTNALSATRLETGSSFTVFGPPRDLSGYDGYYINPEYGLKIGMLIVYVDELRPFEHEGKISRQPVTIGVILEAGHLRKEIRRVLANRLTESEINDLVTDAHELIRERTVARYRLYHIEIEFHVYELDSQVLRQLARASGGRAIGPDAVAQFDARVVL